MIKEKGKSNALFGIPGIAISGLYIFTLVGTWILSSVFYTGTRVMTPQLQHDGLCSW